MLKRLIALALMASLVVGLSVGAGAQAVRKGSWVDEVIFVEEADAAKGITRLEAGDFQIYAQSLSSPDHFRRITANPNLAHYPAFGLYTELSFNPSGPSLPTGLNPFAVRAVREAINILIDRDYIVAEHHGGLAVPRYLPINTAFPDYAMLADVARVLENKYAHNPARAKQIIDAEMRRLGATLVGGKWQHGGKPVEIIFLIRTEDERRQIGDYIAGLLEGIGFTVERRYVTAAQAGPIWMTGDPKEGKWHIVTGGWSSTVISRDMGGNLDFFYTSRGRPDTLWQNYVVVPEFDDIANKLNRNEFTTVEERKALFARGLELAMEDSVRVWLVERISFFPRHKDVTLASDLAGGVSGATLWGHTIRDGNKVGGTVRIALPSMLTNPWNPVAGSNWLFDMMLIRGTSDWSTYPNPYTGLHMPNRVQRAEVFIKKGLPVGLESPDWVTLNFVDEIKVPGDVWIDWDAKTEKFIPVSVAHPDGLTANMKVVIRYPQTLYQTKWHDGSVFSAADVIMRYIILFDRAKTDSKIYDAAAVPAFRSFQAHFRGFKVVSVNPLVLEYYSNSFPLDAEQAVNMAGLWPMYAQGPAPWHTIAIGVLTEAENKLAFSSAKSTANKVEWMNFVAGPSLQVLRNHLGRVLREKYIPYQPTLGAFVTPTEAWVRWNNLTRWWTSKGHMWIGNGPLYIEKVFPIEKVVVLRNFTDFFDPAGKWDRFSAPMMASASISGPARVAPGAAAAFDVAVTFDGRPYAVGDIKEVKFLLFDAEDNLVLQGPAAAVRDGLWRVSLTAAQTAALPVGSAKLEVVVVSRMVSIPTFVAHDIVIRR